MKIFKVISSRFNIGLAIFAMMANCFLLVLYLFGYEKVDYPLKMFGLLLFVPLQLAAIAFFSSPPFKKGFYIATIVTLVLCVITFLFVFYMCAFHH